MADTGEIFGIVVESLCSEAPLEAAQTAAREMIELEIKTAGREDDLIDDMPASTCWLATMHGRDQAFGKLESRDEWIYFKNNVARFQCQSGKSGEADNYARMLFDAFAKE